MKFLRQKSNGFTATSADGGGISVELQNGVVVSIIWGTGAYCGDGTVEVAAFLPDPKDGWLIVEDGTCSVVAQSSDVMGHIEVVALPELLATLETFATAGVKWRGWNKPSEAVVDAKVEARR